MIPSEEDARAFVAARCSAASFGLLERFAAALLDENAQQNLIAAASVPHLWCRHLADSAQLLDHVSRETGLWLDLGSGPGLPGMVIAIMRPGLRVHLVESRRRRYEWLEMQCLALGIPNCLVHGARLETISTVHADIISARAFAPLPRLLELARRFSTNDTRWLLPKGRSAAQELAELPAALQRMFHVEQSQTDAEAGILVGCGKISAKARQA